MHTLQYGRGHDQIADIAQRDQQHAPIAAGHV
jgi:hypothetical protein